MGKKVYYNLTKPQESIWLSEQFSNVPANNIIGTLFFKNDINISLLKESVYLTIKNNQALRTKFVINNTSAIPQQYFDSFSEFDIPVIDFSLKNMIDFREFQKYFSQKCFELIENFLFDFVIVILPNDEIALIGKFHHLIVDAWSLGLVIDNIAINYTKLSNGTNFNLLPGNYFDFINRENNYINSDSYIKSKAFWENTQTGLDQISLKSDIKKTYKANRASFNISKEDSCSINNFCQTNKISPYILFLTAFQIYLYRFTMQKDFLIASPVLNRIGKEKSTIGMFVNMISIPFHVNPNDSIINLLHSSSDNMFTYLKNSKYPYMDLLNDMKKHGSSNPYNIVFSYQNMRPTTDIENLVNYHVEWNFVEYSFDQLAINVTDINNNGFYTIEYDYLSDLFTDIEIKYMHSRINTILNNILLNPNLTVSSIPILSEEEYSEILNLSAGDRLSYDTQSTIITLFEKCVKEYKNNIALVENSKSISYLELSNMVNSIANAISSQKIYNSRIAIMCRKSSLMVAGLLGILKSGNCYIPIDPDYPTDRIQYILDNSESSLFITTSDLENNFEYDTKIILDKIDLAKNMDFKDKSSPELLAYMIYTSGTTGKPKGVKIKHKNIVNTLIWRKTFYEFSSNDSVLQIPSFSFDSSVEDIFTPLISGAKLVIPSSNKIDINSLVNDIEKNNITHFLVVPSLYKILLTEKSDSLKNMSIITIAGESFPISLIKEHFEKLPNVRIVNEYGPTENSVCSTYYELSKNDNIIFIGNPISNCYAYCLDNNLNLLPLGSEGELYVSGPGVADGYFNKEDLTKERFIPNPFVNGLTMYKTGDIVKLHYNRLLEFIGRKDNQIKLHGFRIELKEIENVILENHLVQDVYVVIKNQSNGRNILMAYITSQSKNIDVNQIYSMLREKLPYYMIPIIMQIEKFPLTPNGKIDNKQLPLPNIYKKTFSEPKNEIEKKILKSCREVLGKKDFGVEDNLFIDGSADSLNILSISSKLFAENINIGTQHFYKYPSVRELSNYLLSKEYCKDNSKKEIILPYKTELPNNISKEMLCFSYKNVLLTGSTGFLGAHILYQLIKNTNCTIYCIIREKNNSSPKKRLIKILDYYFGESFYIAYQNRILVVSGDLAFDNFNLYNSNYLELKSKIDCIINAAAITKHYGSSNIFYKENIKTVQNLIKFCNNTNIILNHISTTSVSGNFLVTNTLNCDYDENSFYIGQNYEDNLYVYSKFEAERLILEAEQKGLKANIFRLGNLMARYSDGQFQKNKFDNAYYCRLLALAKIGYLPDALKKQLLEFTPVDDASLAIINLISIPNLSNKIFHILTNKLININILLSLYKKMNIHCKFITNDEFIKQLYLPKNQKALSFIISDINKDKKINYASGIKIKHDITNNYLEKIGFLWNNIDSDYLIRFFNKTNFLDDLNS